MALRGRVELNDGEALMKHQAVIFDLFETLITEWGHKKYTKSEMCSDLGIEREEFALYWGDLEAARYIGDIRFTDSVLQVCEKCGVTVNQAVLSGMLAQRVKTKSACFDYTHPDVIELLRVLKAEGLRLAIVSNCSDEEVNGMKQSKLWPYFDQIILSYEVKLRKPDVRIYQEAARMLGVAAAACAFVGDGGSHELDGAKQAGMTAIQAKWYTNQLPWKRDSMEGFLIAEKPLDVLPYIRQ